MTVLRILRQPRPSTTQQEITQLSHARNMTTDQGPNIRARRTRNLFGLLAVATALVSLGTTSAYAAPQLGVSLERDEAVFPVVHHSDERVDFTVRVKNEAPVAGAASTGAPLTCVTASDDWQANEFVGYRFKFRWLRDGVPLGSWSAADTVAGEEGANFENTTYISRYTVQASDAEGAIQCLVKGTNGIESGSAIMASQPAAVVNPQPAVAPPAPNDLDAFPESPNYPHPRITGTPATAGEMLKCTAPNTGWSISDAISSINWSFEWLRDGEPAPGAVTPVSATESEYELTTEDVSAPAAPAVFQCLVKATNAGGHSTVIESAGFSGQTISPAPEFDHYSAFFNGEGPPNGQSSPEVENAVNSTVAPVTFELELPGGQDTYAYKLVNPDLQGNPPTDWNCQAIPSSDVLAARVICSRAEPLPPGDEYPPVQVWTALGADAPDLGSAKATVFGGGAPAPTTDQLAFPIEPALPFNFSKFTAFLGDEAEIPDQQAGAHPRAGISDIVVNQKRALTTRLPVETELSRMRPVAQTRQVIVDTPPGVVGNPLAVPALCPSVEVVRERKCPSNSMVGTIALVLGGPIPTFFPTQIFAVEPDFGSPAQFVFADPLSHTYSIFARLRPADGYAVSLELAPAPEVDFIESKVTLCNFGVKDPKQPTVCHKSDDFDANPKPLFTNPTSCEVPIATGVRLNSWTDPTFVDGPTYPNATIEGCDEVPFEPTMQVTPTTNLADSPTGLDVDLSIPTEGLEKGTECHEEQGNENSPLAPECLSQANLRNAKVTLPEGLTVNPAGANGLEACSEAQVGISHAGTPNDDPVKCPVASRIGSVEVITPLLKKPLDGAVYQAEQDNNPFGSTLAIYVVAELPERGILVKLAGKVELDPQTGQITSTFADNPQLPFKTFKFHFFGGAAAPLRTPETCGTYSTTSVLTPWSAPQSGPPVTDVDTYAITQGPGGGECPTSQGAMANSPEFDAGTVSPIAATYSPFVVRLSRNDGSQRFASVKLTPPPGLTAKLAGTPACPEAALAAAANRSGREEQASPSCPAASRVGTAHVASGAGPAPFWAKGEAYLAGPYKGAPLSLAVVTPAVAGPFDLGTVVVRTALRVDPASAQITAESDPIPQMLEGIPLDVRTVAIALDKPEFTRNGTSCDPLSFTGQLFTPIGQAAPLSQRFQLGECARLRLKPAISFTLKGGVHRGDYEGLRATLTYPKGEGYANIARTAVTLPHAAFLAQNHIRTVCTRVQFAADQCPKGSIYGRANATSPLLDYPLSGPVYLRSSSNTLPDLVVKLRGPDSQPIEVDLAGRTDSVKGALRNTFDVVPDAPVSQFTLELFGGKRGLIELSSEDFCAGSHRATVELAAQNGLRRTLRPLLRNPHCGKQQRKARHGGGAPRRTGMSAARQSG